VRSVKRAGRAGGYSGIGLAIVVLGVPMYFLWKRREATADR
jgi:hypothetical protein